MLDGLRHTRRPLAFNVDAGDPEQERAMLAALELVLAVQAATIAQ